MPDPVALEAVRPVFRIIAKEFSATSDDDVDDWVTIVAGSITPSVFGARATEAVARLTAHEMTLQARALATAAGSAGVGGVSSVSTGDLSVSYASPSFSASSHEDDDLRQTRHGLAFLRIRDSRYQTGANVLT